MAGAPFDPFARITVFPVLTTGRLVLREITMDDFPWYVRHFSLPEICEGQGSPPPAGEKEARAGFERRVLEPFRDRDGLRWGLCLRREGHSSGTLRSGPGHYFALPLIGSTGVFHVDAKVRSCEMGYDLDPAYWGRGLMREAVSRILDFVFGDMGMNRVEALAMPRNAASRGLLERLGFLEEGVMREHSLDERDALVDDVVFSLLAREWRARRS